jgi:DNA-binding NarL/FixJ family response regulator
MVACLSQDGCRVLGESALLSPEPPLDQLDVLVLEATTRAIGRIVQQSWTERLFVVATLKRPSDGSLRTLADAGVRAFLDRDDVTPDVLGAAVRGVVLGTVTLPSGAFSEMMTAHRDGAIRSLLPREQDVVRLLADGLDTRTISAALSYSERTVKNIVHDVLVKLDSRTRAQAVGVATRKGLI